MHYPASKMPIKYHFTLVKQYLQSAGYGQKGNK